MSTTEDFGVRTSGSIGSGGTSIIPSRVAGQIAITGDISVY